MTRIIIDSTADMTPALRDRTMVVPLTVRFGDQEYIDGVTINHRKFYEMLVESDVLPTTSQAAPDHFLQLYRQIREAGDEAVVLTIASKLSGTYQSAVIAAEEYPEIHVVDSCTATIGTGILAEYALRLAENGQDAKTIAETLTAVRSKVRLVAMVDTLEYLKKGGRISATAAIAGGLLNIKPVIGVRDGEIVTLGKARGSKQGNNLLVKEIEKAGGVDFSMPLLLGYTGLNDVLLQKYVADSAFLWEGNTDGLVSVPIGSVIGTHAGPGAIAVAFFQP